MTGKSDYIPYGKEWEKALMRMKKKDLINILRNQLKKLLKIKGEIKLSG